MRLVASCQVYEVKRAHTHDTCMYGIVYIVCSCCVRSVSSWPDTVAILLPETSPTFTFHITYDFPVRVNTGCPRYTTPGMSVDG